MLEKRIEMYLCRQVKRLNGIPYKFTSPNRRSVPDRHCVFHYKIDVYVECKATDQTPTSSQLREIARLKERECWVVVVDSKRQVDWLINDIKIRLYNERKFRDEL